MDDTGQIILEELPKLINERTKLLSITQVSNALGTVTPVAEVIKIAHAKGVRVLVDGAQSVSHIPTDVQALDADLCFLDIKCLGRRVLARYMQNQNC